MDIMIGGRCQRSSQLLRRVLWYEQSLLNSPERLLRLDQIPLLINILSKLYKSTFVVPCQLIQSPFVCQFGEYSPALVDRWGYGMMAQYRLKLPRIPLFKLFTLDITKFAIRKEVDGVDNPPDRTLGIDLRDTPEYMKITRLAQIICNLGTSLVSKLTPRTIHAR